MSTPKFSRVSSKCIEAALKYWQSTEFLGGKITAIPALHGHSWIHNLMANGTGFHLQLPSEPTIYINGDTVYTNDGEILNFSKNELSGTVT